MPGSWSPGNRVGRLAGRDFEDLSRATGVGPWTLRFVLGRRNLSRARSVAVAVDVKNGRPYRIVAFDDDFLFFWGDDPLPLFCRCGRCAISIDGPVVTTEGVAEIAVRDRSGRFRSRTVSGDVTVISATVRRSELPSRGIEGKVVTVGRVTDVVSGRLPIDRFVLPWSGNVSDILRNFVDRVREDPGPLADRRDATDPAVVTWVCLLLSCLVPMRRWHPLADMPMGFW